MISITDLHSRYVQQARWTADIRRYLFQLAGLEHAARVLEVGCGTGAVLQNLPGMAGQSRYGLDLDPAALRQAAANTPHARLLQGDGLHLPFASDCFDIVCCHFLLLWVSQPQAALSEMRRVARRGGWVLALAEPDYGGRIDYPPELKPAGRLQAAALHSQGADPEMGRKLLALFQSAGLENVSAGVLGGQWPAGSAPTDDAGWSQEWAVLRSDLGNRLSPAEWERLYQVEQIARSRGERILFVPTFYAAGKKETTDSKD